MVRRKSTRGNHFSRKDHHTGKFFLNNLVSSVGNDGYLCLVFFLKSNPCIAFTLFKSFLKAFNTITSVLKCIPSCIYEDSHVRSKVSVSILKINVGRYIRWAVGICKIFTVYIHKCMSKFDLVSDGIAPSICMCVWQTQRNNILKTLII